ncbi:MAG: hypothetical protein JEZ14_04360 [Marinilabiliaceae bacterium]|nr:hypothetical protein [Marinilabiliaceae bacterium]
MKKLFVSCIKLNDESLEAVSQALDVCQSESIDVVNWETYPYKPEVSFKIAYSEDALYVKFSVVEKAVRAINDQPNGSVWEDSCCEFFCDFDGKGYYNLETNCIGTQLLGWGNGNREHADAKVINSIKKLSSLGTEPFDVKTGEFNYEIVMAIPASAFYAHQLSFKKGMCFRANFYKCGDKTPDAHFLSWNPIEVEQPNFHLPEFFGEVELL